MQTPLLHGRVATAAAAWSSAANCSITQGLLELSVVVVDVEAICIYGESKRVELALHLEETAIHNCPRLAAR